MTPGTTLVGSRIVSGGWVRSRALWLTSYSNARCSKSRSRNEYAGPNLSLPGSPDHASVNGSPVVNGRVKSMARSVEYSVSVLNHRLPPSESFENWNGGVGVTVGLDV